MASEKQVLDMQSGKNNDILVAIWMVTYNQEAYIEQAVESVMMQITDFRYKLFIGEDCSTDKTREICIALQEKYPDKIELILNEKNIGGNLNAKNIYNACFNSGAKYIAMLEGDDYWTDANKLQKQVEVLEKNPECNICFTNYSIVRRNGDIIPSMARNIFSVTDFTDLIKGNYINTLSVVFRKGKINELPEWFSKLKIGDWALYLFLLKNGEKALYLNEVTGVYRYGVGISHKLSSTYSNFIKSLLDILYCLEKEEMFSRFLPQIKTEIEKMNLELLANLMREKKYKKGMIVFFKCFFYYEKIKVIKYFLYCIKIKANYANNRNNQ